MTHTPITPDWYTLLLGRIELLITKEESFEMRRFPDYFREGISTARMEREKILGHLEVFVCWLRRKLLWSKDHNGLFFRETSRIL